MLNNGCWTSVQEDRHQAALGQETSNRIKIEKDFEEKCRELNKTAEDKNVTEQQLEELQLLIKKVGN